MRKPKLYLLEIIEQINDIYEYVQNISIEDFEEDSKTSKAVVRSFEIIGEAVKHLPDDLKAQTDYKNWRQIGAMRNKLIHEYFGVDYTIVWESIKSDLPELKSVIEYLLTKIEQNS